MQGSAVHYHEHEPAGVGTVVIIAFYALTMQHGLAYLFFAYAALQHAEYRVVFKLKFQTCHTPNLHYTV